MTSPSDEVHHAALCIDAELEGAVPIARREPELRIAVQRLAKRFWWKGDRHQAQPSGMVAASSSANSGDSGWAMYSRKAS